MKKLAQPIKPRKCASNNLQQILVLITCLPLLIILAVSWQGSSVATATLEPDEFVFIPVPMRSVVRGDAFSKVELVSLKWPKLRDSKAFIRDAAELRQSYARQDLPANLPILRDHISASPPDSNAVVDRIPIGMRAVSIKVDAESAVEGWAQTGNYVDVLLVSKIEATGPGVETQIIAENVRVLSLGRSVETRNSTPTNLSNDRSGVATVTLLVNQSDALKIKTASTIGRLAFSLRGLGDEEPSYSREMTDRELLNGRGTVAPKKRIGGYAVGPDGQKYLLADNQEWILNQP